MFSDGISRKVQGFSNKFQVGFKVVLRKIEMCLEGARDYSKDVQRLVQGSPMVF